MEKYLLELASTNLLLSSIGDLIFNPISSLASLIIFVKYVSPNALVPLKAGPHLHGKDDFLIDLLAKRISFLSFSIHSELTLYISS